MATMATIPPLTPPCDLPVWLLPSNFYGDYDDIDTTNLLDPYWLYDENSPIDFSAITDIPMTNGVERYNEHTDLSVIEPSRFQTPPTPEPEPSPIQKPEVVEGVIKQETSNEAFSFSIEEDGKLKYEENELPSPEGMPQQQQQQQQQQFQENEIKVENDEKEQLEPHSKEDETSEKAEERPTRRCHSRYAFRPTLSSAKPCRPTVRKQVVLWKFLEELLDTNENNSVSWVSREEGTFRFVDSKLAAKLWGQRKNKRNMTYEKLSRALRYYYDRQIMFHEEGQKLIYRFGDIVMKNRKPSTVEAS